MLLGSCALDVLILIEDHIVPKVGAGANIATWKFEVSLWAPKRPITKELIEDLVDLVPCDRPCWSRIMVQFQL